MADIKTTLRELSVIVGIYTEVNNIPYFGRPSDFTDICTSALPNVSANYFSDIAGLSFFDTTQKQIISNGFNLSKQIIAKFKINSVSELNWYGFDTHKEEPYDISINGLLFSLKEESFILENMGLYKLLNCYTGSCYKKRHIFRDYARTEYENWFRVTWEEMLTVLHNNHNRWEYANTAKNKEGIISIKEKIVSFVFIKNGSVAARSELSQDCTLSVFENNTNAKIREEVFAKFINANLDNNQKYNIAKKVCAVTASEALAQELTDNLNYHAGLPRFLRIHKSEYYYAKTTSSGVEIYKVPALSDYENNIIIESIVASVPDKQANILTTIKNTKTGKKLILRNECRFSHGQFNGTPEAKMYYESGGSLLTVYEPI